MKRMMFLLIVLGLVCLGVQNSYALGYQTWAMMRGLQGLGVSPADTYYLMIMNLDDEDSFVVIPNASDTAFYDTVMHYIKISNEGDSTIWVDLVGDSIVEFYDSFSLHSHALTLDFTGDIGSCSMTMLDDQIQFRFHDGSADTTIGASDGLLDITDSVPTIGDFVTYMDALDSYTCTIQDGHRGESTAYLLNGDYDDIDTVLLELHFDDSVDSSIRNLATNVRTVTDEAGNPQWRRRFLIKTDESWDRPIKVHAIRLCTEKPDGTTGSTEVWIYIERKVPLRGSDEYWEY